MIDDIQIEVIEDNKNLTIACGGILDFTNTEKLNIALKDAAENAESVTVDFRTADFIDTAVVQYLAKAAMTMLGRGKHLQVIVTSSGYPLQVLQISGFKKIMDITVEADNLSG